MTSASCGQRMIRISAGDMGSWEVDVSNGRIEWDAGPYRIFDVDPALFNPTVERIEALIHPDDREKSSVAALVDTSGHRFQTEFRIVGPEAFQWSPSPFPGTPTMSRSSATFPALPSKRGYRGPVAQ